MSFMKRLFTPRVNRQAKWADAQATWPQPGDSTPPARTLRADRFDISITENIATAGLDTTKYMKYRWMVTDKETGTIQKVDYQFTMRLAQADARRYVDKLIDGRRRLR